MKRHKKITATLFVVTALLIFGLFTQAGAQLSSNDSDEYIYDTEIFFAEDLFNDEVFMDELHQELVSVMGEDFMRNYMSAQSAANAIDRSFIQDRNGRTIYPDSYGGSYFDDDGKLVVLVVQTPNAAQGHDRFLTLARMGGSIMREAEYSYSYLYKVMDMITEAREVQPNHPAARNVLSWGPSIINNSVLVQLFDYSDEQIRLFRENIVDSPALEFIAAPDELPGLAVRTFSTSPSSNLPNVPVYGTSSSK
jgi:hypothetical protein